MTKYIATTIDHLIIKLKDKTDNVLNSEEIGNQHITSDISNRLMVRYSGSLLYIYILIFLI